MVDRHIHIHIYIYTYHSSNGVYKPTWNCGATHCAWPSKVEKPLSWHHQVRKVERCQSYLCLSNTWIYRYPKIAIFDSESGVSNSTGFWGDIPDLRQQAKQSPVSLSWAQDQMVPGWIWLSRQNHRPCHTWSTSRTSDTGFPPIGASCHMDLPLHPCSAPGYPGVETKQKVPHKENSSWAWQLWYLE